MLEVDVFYVYSSVSCQVCLVTSQGLQLGVTISSAVYLIVTFFYYLQIGILVLNQKILLIYQKNYLQDCVQCVSDVFSPVLMM